MIFHTIPPPDVPFNTYNTDSGLTMELLAADGFRNTTVPYQANRLVMFQSDLFHKSDEFSFKTGGFADRRINLTYLFGERMPVQAS